MNIFRSMKEMKVYLFVDDENIRYSNQEIFVAHRYANIYVKCK